MHMTKRYGFIFIFLVSCILIVIGFYELQGNAYILFRNIPKEIVLNRIKDYEAIETQHFTIRHKTNDKRVLEMIRETSEKHYKDICNDFQYFPLDKSTIILYEDSDEFLKNSNLKASKPPMGVYYASTIQILSPRKWNIPQENMEYIFKNEGPMIHEFTHLIVDDITKGNYPLWFTEGLALYQEYDKTGYEWGKDVAHDKIYSINELDNKFNKLNQYLAYTQSFRVVKYIVEEYGFNAINKILRELEKGNSFNKSFERVTGENIEVLDN